MKVLPPPFRYSLGNYIYFFYIHFSELKLIARSVPVLKLPEKKYYSFFLEYRLLYVTKKSRVSAENIGIKVSVLQPS